MNREEIDLWIRVYSGTITAMLTDPEMSLPGARKNAERMADDAIDDLRAAIARRRPS